MLADGTELGMGRENHCGPHSSGKGSVPRPARVPQVPQHKGRSVYQWPEGDVGYIKGIAIAANGDQDHTHLSLSNSALPRLLWYESDSYGFYARQTTGNRIVLYGRTSNGHTSWSRYK